MKALERRPGEGRAEYAMRVFTLKNLGGWLLPERLQQSPEALLRRQPARSRPWKARSRPWKARARSLRTPHINI